MRTFTHQNILMRKVSQEAVTQYNLSSWILLISIGSLYHHDGGNATQCVKRESWPLTERKLNSTLLSSNYMEQIATITIRENNQ